MTQSRSVIATGEMRKHGFRKFLLVSLVLVSACGSDLPSGAILHPVTEYMPFASVAIANNNPEVNDSLTAVVEGLLQYEDQKELGTGDFDDVAEYIGTIEDVELAENSLVYLLDEANSNVKVYDKNSELIAVVGTSGEGPGEFRAPKGIHVDAGGRILLSDGGQRSQILVPSPGAPGHYAADVIEQLIVDGVFADDGSLVALAEYQTDSLLIKMMPTGEETDVRYFGRKYNSSNIVVNWNMSEGILVPGPNGEFIVVFRKMPLVVKFDEELQVEWATLIPDYIPLKSYGYTNNDGNHVSRVERKGITDMLQDAVILEGGKLLVQIARVDAALLKGIISTDLELRNYVVDLDSGRMDRIKSNLVLDEDGHPLSIMEWGEEYYVVGTSYPNPKAFLRKR